jgi:hypothetical protein
MRYSWVGWMGVAMTQTRAPRLSMGGYERKQVVVLCSNSNCSMTKFLVQLDFGLDFTFHANMTPELAQRLEVRPPALVLLHTNGDGFQDWGAIISKIKELAMVPIVVMSNDEKRRKSFKGKVELTLLTPQAYDDRVRLVAALVVLAHGVGPGAICKAVSSELSEPGEQAIAVKSRALIGKVIVWIFSITLLLSLLAASAVLLLKQDVELMVKAFTTTMTATLGVFTSAGVIRVVKWWLQSRGGPRN